MVDPAGSALVGVAVYGQTLYNSWRPRKVGIYGSAMVGKTTLDRYMTTPGEMDEISDEERTSHMKLLGRFIMPKASHKRWWRSIATNCWLQISCRLFSKSNLSLS